MQLNSKQLVRQGAAHHRAGDLKAAKADYAAALEDTVDIDCFSPPRADWLSGEDTYLRGDDAD